MYCIECGAQIPDNSKFCSHCGHKQMFPSLENHTTISLQKYTTFMQG